MRFFQIQARDTCQPTFSRINKPPSNTLHITKQVYGLFIFRAPVFIFWGCYTAVRKFEIYIKHSAPSSEGAVERSETEGVKKIISNYKTPSVIFLRKNDSPLKDGAETQIELYIQWCRAVACCRRANLRIYNNYRLLSYIR